MVNSRAPVQILHPAVQPRGVEHQVRFRPPLCIRLVAGAGTYFIGQARTVMSMLAEARTLPSAENATEVMGRE